MIPIAVFVFIAVSFVMFSPIGTSSIGTFMESEKLEAPIRCYLPVDSGYGLVRLSRYYYSDFTKVCHSFVYKGHGGNNNNFRSYSSCMAMCNEKFTKRNICQQLPIYGDCMHTIVKYFYNTRNKKCEEFVYSGCGGNLNNFSTSEECYGICKTGSK